MNGIMNLVSCENRKIFSQRKYRVYLVVVSLIVIAGAAVSKLPGNIIGFTLANYPYTVLSMLGYFFAPIAIFMLASDLISGEIAGGEIRLLLTKPVSRASVLFAKVSSIAVYVGILYISQLMLSGIISMVFAGFAAISIPTAFMAYIVGYLPMLAMIAMSVGIASMLKSGTSCFGYSLLAYIGFNVLGLVFSGLSPAIFTSYLGLGSMVIGSAIPVASLLMGLVVLAGYSLTFLSLGGMRFAEREF